MPYRRGGFALTPPLLVIFLISPVLALIALLIRYAHVSVPIISSSRVFDVWPLPVSCWLSAFCFGAYDASGACPEAVTSVGRSTRLLALRRKHGHVRPWPVFP